MLHAVQHRPAEWAFTSTKTYPDPFNEIELDVLVTDPDGETRRVPTFWAGDGTWRVRYAAAKPGLHRWRTECSDPSNDGLHGCEGTLDVTPYEGDHPLFGHGPLRMSANQRHLEHRDGTPFFWLGDTWWMGLCRRLRWPDEFRTLTLDRVQKGFTVVQIVAGLYPDMPGFDERGANEAGFPWEPEYARINPAYWDNADLRIAYLVEQGLVPCIVGCWGYYLRWLGIEKMKQHWRHLIARYGAYPVVWCLAGEGAMPYYLTETREEDIAFQKRGWTELGRYVRETDPYGHPVTIHPTGTSRDQIDDESILDLNMLQTGHGDRRSISNTVRRVRDGYAATPTIPVLNSEVCYEGIGEACRQEVQRFMFWVCMLSGACGHTYGANGIWQVNRKEAPYGPSPHGMAWGHTPWDEAMALPGSRQLGLSAALLRRYEWWRIEPHLEWVEPHAGENERFIAPYAAGIPGELRIVFLPSGVWGITVVGLEREVRYHAFLFSPVDGSEVDLGTAEPDEKGQWRIPLRRVPIFQDWVLVLNASRG